MKGEAFVHGFTLAMTAQNRFYRPESEKDTQGGYADIFLLPMIGIRYADTEVVKRNIGTTILHKIVVFHRGMEMVVCEEVL